MKRYRVFIIFLLFGTLIQNSYSQNNLEAEVEVIWEGGPDLVVPFFIPPLIQSESGNTIYISFRNANNGNLASLESMTRIYISTNEIINPKLDRSLGGARVAALDANELTDERKLQFTVPSDFLPGRYYLAACADADNEVVELNEENNCSFSKLDNYVSVTTSILPNPNKAPICDAGSPSVSSLWPPNHKLKNIEINGVTDPDDDPIEIKIISIMQDEAVNGLGDGDTSPDGFGLGTAIAQVRAERSGLGNGRVYIINFTASDDKESSCTGSVTVGVPHDKSSSNVINDGVRYNSTSK